jgi:hypothetical protein
LTTDQLIVTQLILKRGRVQTVSIPSSLSLYNLAGGESVHFASFLPALSVVWDFVFVPQFYPKYISCIQ